LELVDMELEVELVLPFDQEDSENRAVNGNSKQERRKSRKSVRFVNVTPEKEVNPVAAVARPTPNIQIDIPLKMADNSQANISVNESRLCLTGSLKNTPKPNRRPEMTSSINHYQMSHQDNAPPVSMATPMALRYISNKAQRELASLYDDVENDHPDEGHTPPPVKNLFQD